MIAAIPQATTRRHPPLAIGTFVALTVGWTWGLWAAVSLIGLSASRLSGALFLVSAVGPGVAAFTTVLTFEGKAGFVRWLKGSLRWRLE